MALHKAHFSARAIADTLKIPIRTVYDQLSRARDTRRYSDRPRSGRPKKTGGRVKSRVRRLALDDGGRSVRQIQAQLGREGVALSIGGVYNTLKSAGLRCVKPQKKTKLSAAQRVKRLAFAREHIGDSDEEIRSVVYSDEKIFTIGGRSAHQWIRIEDPIPTYRKGTDANTGHFRTHSKTHHTEPSCFWPNGML